MYRQNMEGNIMYIYEPGSVEWPNKAVELIDDHDLDVETTNASNWDASKKEEFYHSKLFPRSIRQGKKLRGRIRTHQAGNINFYKGVLLTGGVEEGDFFVGQEALHLLGSMTSQKV